MHTVLITYRTTQELILCCCDASDDQVCEVQAMLLDQGAVLRKDDGLEEAWALHSHNEVA